MTQPTPAPLSAIEIAEIRDRHDLCRMDVQEYEDALPRLLATIYTLQAQIAELQALRAEVRELREHVDSLKRLTSMAATVILGDNNNA